MSEQEEGTVKWFSKEKFFGFLTSGSRELFFHGSEVQFDISGVVEGARVKFEEGMDKRSGRPRAVKVKLIEE